jgi:hypothetical protein
MAPDQRYCLSCGTRRGEPRVEPATPRRAQQAAPASAQPTAVAAPPPRQADVSPLAAVIGIALLGGMLLIGVLIGRGVNDDPPPAPVVNVSESAASGGGAVESEWPAGTDGFTVQLSTLPKDGATPESVEAAKQEAIDAGASDAAVLDSDLYSTLPPGNYVIYSGVFTDRKSAETALEGLSGDLPAATVVEVADSSASADTESSSDAEATTTPDAGSVTPEDLEAIVPGAGTESEVPPADADGESN